MSAIPPASEVFRGNDLSLRLANRRHQLSWSRIAFARSPLCLNNYERVIFAGFGRSLKRRHSTSAIRWERWRRRSTGRLPAHESDWRSQDAGASESTAPTISRTRDRKISTDSFVAPLRGSCSARAVRSRSQQKRDTARSHDHCRGRRSADAGLV